jgi:hypothetical protein
VAYIDAIIQRWKREDNWGAPHPDMGEDQPRGDSKQQEVLAHPAIRPHMGEDQPRGDSKQQEVLAHTANRIYQEVTGVTPTAEQAELICDAFSEGVPPHIQTEWRTALKEWMAGVTHEGRAYNPRNVPSILNFYHKKQRHSGVAANLTETVSRKPFQDSVDEGLATPQERHSWEHTNFAYAKTAADQRRVLAEFDEWLEPRRQAKAERLATEAAAADEPTGVPAAAPDPRRAGRGMCIIQPDRHAGVPVLSLAPPLPRSFRRQKW